MEIYEKINNFMVENAWKNKGENGWILCVKMQGKIKVKMGGNLWKNK